VLAMLAVLQLFDAIAQLTRELEGENPPGIAELDRLDRVLKAEMAKKRTRQ
jgi:hypothetical protein